MPITPIDLRKVDEQAANIYEGLIVAAKRARKINDENKIEYNALVSTIPVGNSDDDSEDIENPAQLKISLDFEKREKPHVLAVHELLEGKVQFKYKK